MTHHQRLVEQVLGKQNLEVILKDVDAARIDLGKMDSIAAHRDLPEVKIQRIRFCIQILYFILFF